MAFRAWDGRFLTHHHHSNQNGRRSILSPYGTLIDPLEEPSQSPLQEA